MVSVKSASRYHPRYQSRSSMCIRGLFPRNFAELTEAVPIDAKHLSHLNVSCERPQNIVANDINPYNMPAINAS